MVLGAARTIKCYGDCFGDRRRVSRWPYFGEFYRSMEFRSGSHMWPLERGVPFWEVHGRLWRFHCTLIRSL